MAHKLENPKRLEELSPKETLIRIGVSGHSAFCDIGAGTGIFTYAAAEITANNIFAVEISDEMREILRSKNDARNVIIEDSIQNVPPNSCDTALLCTVLHELNNIPDMIREIRRILKTDGVLAVIEFHKAQTPMGPPAAHRISERETSEILTENGFTQINRIKLGENFYCLVFEKTQKSCKKGLIL